VKWRTVRIPAELLDEVEKFLKDDLARREGYNSKAQFITDAIREYLHRYKSTRPRLEHMNVYENRVTILDRELERYGRIVDVFLKKDTDEIVYPYCSYCRSNDCLHVDFAFEIPKVRETLQKAGIRKRIRGEEVIAY